MTEMAGSEPEAMAVIGGDRGKGRDLTESWIWRACAVHYVPC